jgi:hypothetical protein
MKTRYLRWIGIFGVFMALTGCHRSSLGSWMYSDAEKMVIDAEVRAAGLDPEIACFHEWGPLGLYYPLQSGINRTFWGLGGGGGGDGGGGGGGGGDN